ncbi:ATP-binding cassette domain-containing protein [Pelagibius marinus]|uniref:ATP-binding cassette domain-containing protein n=1 Tax=Pelagibius marinus TaxID=2762760 RepID=UPI0018727C3A|nr:ATP-binding cassette domain-containing protein [Pelagibius marinus]
MSEHMLHTQFTPIFPNECDGTTEVVKRVAMPDSSKFTLADGSVFQARRFLPLGKGDHVLMREGELWVLAKRDDVWINIFDAWIRNITLKFLGKTIQVEFKEIETLEELEQFEALRKFHYRGGGGAGRTVPIIGRSNIWDLPSVLGFIEVSSSMIANTARKRFLDYPYRENGELLWSRWDHASARKYSNMICRISRFVIHPELRGLGLAKEFLEAAIQYAEQRWFFGGFKPRFIEITADMLRYYPFVGQSFVFMGETEGNGHRIQKDMSYLVRRAQAGEDIRGMPQGGGGIMTLQRGYAAQLIKYLKKTNKSLPDVIHSLKFDPSTLDQETWEALYRLNRRPKPSYIMGLTTNAKSFVSERCENHYATVGSAIEKEPCAVEGSEEQEPFIFTGISVHARAQMAQSREARSLQDSFGFVGSELDATIIQPFDFTLAPGTITLICGGSGSGKTLLVQALSQLSDGQKHACDTEICGENAEVHIAGEINRIASVGGLESIPGHIASLDLIGKGGLEEFLKVTASCGLAEPQLFVRPVSTLSSGQMYRLQIALAFLKHSQIVAVDNFCEPLDAFTMAAVCRRIRHLVREYNVAFVAATASYDRVGSVLQPDQRILLRRGDSAIVLEDSPQ